MPHHTGTVAWFSNLKGYGYLTCDGGPEVFCDFRAIHRSDFTTLHPGERVAFDVVESETGPQAQNVTVPSDEASQQES